MRVSRSRTGFRSPGVRRAAHALAAGQAAVLAAVLAAVRTAVLAAVLCLLAGCGTPFPADPDGTLERVRSEGILRAGASVHPPQVELPPTKGADPEGSEVEMVEEYAGHLGVRVDWTLGSETELVEGLEAGSLDVMVAGLLEDSVWSDRAALTRGYAETIDDGSSVRRVVAVPMGENALMADLERFMDHYVGEEP